MTERERIILTLKHIGTNIVPYHLDLTEEVHARLEKYYNDIDFFEKTGSYLAQERNESFEVQKSNIFKDMFGVVWNKKQEGDFGIVEDYLFKEPELGNYIFPVPDIKHIEEKCRRLEKQRTKFRMYIIGFSLFERAWTLRSMPEFLIDMKINKNFANELLDRIVQYNNTVVDIVSKFDIDCIFYGDDWGQQKGLIMGPEIWREFIKPRLKSMYDSAKKYGMYVAQHSCGDIHEVFPDLVEIGLDIYNTFQPEIYNIEEMKEKYGDKITFYGGISTQRLLPAGKPQEVKEEMKRIIKILSKDGGYIIAPTHSIPNDVPTENIIAFLDLVQNQ
jgi:uroporphyrinogen decarboxylase